MIDAPPLIRGKLDSSRKALRGCWGMKMRRPERGSLLLVDDDALVRRSIRRLVGDEHDLEDAASSEEARVALARRRFDLVLLDIELSLGVPDGLDCLRWLPDTGHRGAVCMFTGHLSPELMHEALLLGADDYLVKLIGCEIETEVARLVELGRLPREERPHYETIADPGLLRSLRLNADQIEIVVEMLEQGFPPDKRLADDLGLGAKALAERIARIEARFGTKSRHQLIRYLTVLAGYVRRSRLEQEPEDRRSLLAGATRFDLPRNWSAHRED